MTFSKLQDRLYKNIQRDDFLVANSPDLNYGTFINDGLQEIQKRRSWSYMKKSVDLTIASGQNEIALPDDFKELQNVHSPVNVVLTDPNVTGDVLKPVEVVYEEDELRRVWAFGGLVWTVRTFLERFGNSAKLRIVVPAAEDIKFRVKYFGYLPALSDDSDESVLEVTYPRMVLAKSKAVAFFEINDGEAESASNTEFEKQFAAAAIQDSRSDVSGRETRM